MWNNKRGAALMQVLLITAILAGMTTMLLRSNLTRTASARKTRRTVSAEMLIQACMAEVNAFWVAKTIDAYNRDLNGEIGGKDICMRCKTFSGTTCTGCEQTYACQEFKPYGEDGPTYQVTATISKDANNNQPQITYEITTGSADL